MLDGAVSEVLRRIVERKDKEALCCLRLHLDGYLKSVDGMLGVKVIHVSTN
jgi:hypothetical protein